MASAQRYPIQTAHEDTIQYFNMYSFNLKLFISIFALLYGFVMALDDLKEDADRGASDRGTLWFGPRLGKRSLRISNDDNKQTFLRLLEAADALKYYYDQLPFYESQADDPETRVTKKVIFTPKLGRSVDVYPDKRAYENLEFTPRLGRRLPEKMPVTPSDIRDEVYSFKPEMEDMESRTSYYSPRLGRTVNFSPRLGRELSYGITSLIIIQTGGYVLLAANLEDFKSIAKQFVPEKLANQLAQLASQSAVKYRQDQAGDDDVTTESEEVQRREITELSDQEYTDKDVPLSKINFEDLVQKVKERIEKDLGNQKKIIIDKREPDYSQEEQRPVVTRFLNEHEKTTKTVRRPIMQRQVKAPMVKRPPKEDNGMMFSKIDLKDNDSYEDYVTPVKEKNIFESDAESPEDKPTTVKRVLKHTTKTTTDYYQDKTEELKEDSGEIKAKTEDLWYDDKMPNISYVTTESTPQHHHQPSVPHSSTKRAKGTLIPKRDFYKISSPNYLAKVPIVAEKYDFNEPIPERDRIPEFYRPLRGLPYPSIINGKIKMLPQ